MKRTVGVYKEQEYLSTVLSAGIHFPERQVFTKYTPVQCLKPMLTFPEGGESFTVGQTVVVTWETGTNQITDVDKLEVRVKLRERSANIRTLVKNAMRHYVFLYVPAQGGVMRRTVSLIIAALISPGAACAGSFLHTLVTTGGGVVIAYGANPSSLAAANIIRDEIRTLPGQTTWNTMRTAASFDADTFMVTGATHVIAVGTVRDNVVIQNRTWLSTWWLDRDAVLSAFAALPAW